MEEIKRNYIDKDEQIKIIKIIIDYQIKLLEDLFYKCDCIDFIYFKQFYRHNINNMRYMFYDCTSLQELTINNCYTNNVNNMSGMFYNCSSLKKLNVNNFNTSNVTNMSMMDVLWMFIIKRNKFR